MNVSDLLTKKIFEKQLSFELDKSITDKLIILEPLRFEGFLRNLDELILLQGEIKGVIEVNCSRCLKELGYNVSISIDEKFTSNDKDIDDDYLIFIDKDQINLSEVLDSSLLFALPMKVLCSEECKGICQHCGLDNNIENCSCNDNIVNPEFDKLKDMFSRN